MRINNVTKTEIDEFVDAVAGKNLSTRDIEISCPGLILKGGRNCEKQIKDGDIVMGTEPAKTDLIGRGGDCTERERQMLTALEISAKIYAAAHFKMQRYPI